MTRPPLALALVCVLARLGAALQLGAAPPVNRAVRLASPCMSEGVEAKRCAMISLSADDPLRLAKVLKRAWMEGCADAPNALKINQNAANGVAELDGRANGRVAPWDGPYTIPAPCQLSSDPRSRLSPVFAAASSAGWLVPCSLARTLSKSPARARSRACSRLPTGSRSLLCS